MKKIVIRNDYLIGGGVENVLYTLVNYLTYHNYNITVITDKGSKKEASQLFNKNIHFIKAHLFFRCKPFSIKWFVDKIYYILYKLIIRHFMNFDIVIALKEGYSMLEMSYMNGKKIAWVHVDYKYIHWTRHCFKNNESELECMRKYDNVICVSKAAKESVITTIGDPGNLCFKYNPIDTKLILQKSTLTTIERPSEILFISVGRLDESKQYLLLIDVVYELSKQYNFNLWIIGDGKQKNEIMKKICNYKLDNVKLLGNQDNPYPFMRAADCFISSSKCESYGLAIQESFVLGVPVIAAECPAIKEVVNTNFGIITKNSFDGLKQGMEKILKEPKILEDFRKNIHGNFDHSRLYDNRLKDICSIWEDENE